jgi:hypothetical protein
MAQGVDAFALNVTVGPMEGMTISAGEGAVYTLGDPPVVFVGYMVGTTGHPVKFIMRRMLQWHQLTSEQLSQLDAMVRRHPVDGPHPELVLTEDEDIIETSNLLRPCIIAPAHEWNKHFASCLHPMRPNSKRMDIAIWDENMGVERYHCAFIINENGYMEPIGDERNCHLQTSMISRRSSLLTTNSVEVDDAGIKLHMICLAVHYPYDTAKRWVPL